MVSGTNSVLGQSPSDTRSEKGSRLDMRARSSSSSLHSRDRDRDRASRPGLMTSRNLRSEAQNLSPVQKSDSKGLLSTFLSAAQTTLGGKQNVSSETLSSSLKSSKKPGLLIVPPTSRFEQFNLPSILTITPNAGDLEARVSNGSYMTDVEDTPKQDGLMASNVHFELVSNTPLSTLGNGNLTLQSFDKSWTTDQRIAQSDQKIVPDGANAAPDTNKVARENLLNRKLTFSASTKKSLRRLLTSSVEESKVLSENSDGDKQSLLSELQSFMESDLEISAPTKKRNREFHHTFKNVPALEKLLASYSCALSKDILVQGKIYISKNFLCFNSNILGWVTNLIIPLQEVIQIEKKTTVLWLPNGIAITTLHQKHLFATFHARDAAFDLLTKIWQNCLTDNKPSKPPSLQRKSTGRSMASKKAGLLNSEWSEEDSAPTDDEDDLQLTSLSEDYSMDEDENIITKSISKRKLKPTNADQGSVKSTHNLDYEVDVDANESTNESEESPKASKKSEGTFKGFFNPGPAKHAPTSFDHSKGSNDVLIIEKKFNAPLGVIFNMLYGPDNSSYVKILEAQKNFNITKDKITGLSKEQAERSYLYTKPLSGPIGPKQTKCLISESLEQFDLSSYCEVLQVTQTPDVPLGNSFKIKTLLYFNWAESNTTQMTVYTSIEWSAKSWIKGAIEKGSIDGQKQSMQLLSDTIMEIVASGDLSGSGSKRKRRGTTITSTPSEDKTQVSPQETQKPLTFIELISKILESIGLHVGFKVPMLDDVALGAVVMITISFFYSYTLIWMAGGKSNISIGRQGGSNIVEIDGRPFNLIPTPETYLSNDGTRKAMESKMWDWIISRTDSDATLLRRSPRAQTSEHVSPEFEEIVDLTRKRLDEIYFNIS